MLRNSIWPCAIFALAAITAPACAANGRQIQHLAEQTAQPHGRPAEIILPARLAAGKPATLAVLDEQGQLAAGVTVELSTDRRVTTDATGRARFVVTAEPGPFTAIVVGSTVRAWAKVTAPSNVPASTVMLTQCPQVILPSERFSVAGFNFRPDADENRVKLGGQTALVLAASPVAMEILPAPQVSTGQARFQVEAGLGASGCDLNVVKLQIMQTAGVGTPGPDRKMRLAVRVEGTNDPLKVAIWNQSPDVIEIEGGNLQRVTTRPRQTNEAAFTIHTLRGGKFSITARPASANNGPTDFEVIRRELEAARGLASGDWAARVDAEIEQLDRARPAIAGIQRDLERLLLQNPPAAVGRHVETAWLAFLR
jgi:hypothetical protein